MSNEILAARLSQADHSPSIAANALVMRLRREGLDIVNFTLGEPDLDTPPNIVAAAITGLENGQTHYTETAGTLELRQAIASKLRRDNDLDYHADEIVVGCGAKHVIAHAFAATIDPGDEVIIPAPYWVSYPDLTRLQGGIPVIVRCGEQQGFRIDPQALDQAITTRTKWLVLNSPNNPSGAVYTASELEALGAVLKRNPHVLILSDEIYEYFLYGSSCHISIARVVPELRSRILIVNGASKSYAMTGWRLGYGAGPRFLVAAIIKLMSQTTTCASSLSQAAGVEAFGGSQLSVSHMRDIYQRRGAMMVSALKQVPGISCCMPQGAFYLFANVSGLMGGGNASDSLLETDGDVADFLLQRGVAVVAGAAYGLSPFIRLSFACPEEVIRSGCARIAAACRERLSIDICR